LGRCRGGMGARSSLVDGGVRLVRRRLTKHPQSVSRLVRPGASKVSGEVPAFVGDQPRGAFANPASRRLNLPDRTQRAPSAPSRASASSEVPGRHESAAPPHDTGAPRGRGDPAVAGRGKEWRVGPGSPGTNRLREERFDLQLGL